MIQKRISVLSDTKDTFEQEAPFYQNALRECGYKDAHLVFDPPAPAKKKQRKRSVLYFNPPFCKSVKTEVGEIFLRLLDKHFPVGHRLHRFINRHNTKVSYCTMKSVKAYIAAHNRKVLNPSTTDTSRKCNCRSFESRLKARNRCPNKILETTEKLRQPRTRLRSSKSSESGNIFEILEMLG